MTSPDPQQRPRGPRLPPGERRELLERVGRRRRPWRGAWPWLLVLLIVLVWFGADLASPDVEEIRYGAFKAALDRGDVREVEIGETEIRGVLLRRPEPEEPGAEEPEPEPEGEPEREEVRFETVRVEDPDLVAQLEEAGVEYSGIREGAFWQIAILWLVPLGLLFLFAMLLFGSAARRAGGQVMSFGRSRAKLVPETGTGVTFDDVAGADEAKEELRELVDFLRSPARFTSLGGRIPKGVLLLGPPGTGKTLLARAVAGEAAVPFFSLTGSDFVEMFVGVGAARVRDLFEKAKERAPCIVFIDEIDAIGRQRGVQMGAVNDEREQTLNQLLSEMDGFENNAGVILLAATNRPDVLDRALLRPGRFDRQVVLDAPDLRGRRKILEVHARGKPMADDVDLDRIARASPGMSGADLANALNEAALLAARAKRDRIAQADLEEALERVVAGPERRSRRLEEEEKRRVAYHESGHALVAAHSAHADPVQKITIVPRGHAALGMTMQLPEEERYVKTAHELFDRLAVMLGGRASEELVLGDVSTGATDDLRVATDLARQMVCVFGMSARIGLAQCARPADGAFLRGDGAMQRDCSETTSREIDEEVRALLDEAHRRAREILEAHRDQLEEIAGLLLERETLDKREFEAIVRSAERDDHGERAGADRAAAGGRAGWSRS